MAEKVQSTEETPKAESPAPPPPPKRSLGHRGADPRDTAAELAARAHQISLEAGSKMAGAMRDLIHAAAGISGFVVETARDVTQFMVRRGQLAQDEAERLIREAEEAYAQRVAGGYVPGGLPTRAAGERSGAGGSARTGEGGAPTTAAIAGGAPEGAADPSTTPDAELAAASPALPIPETEVTLATTAEVAESAEVDGADPGEVDRPAVAEPTAAQGALKPARPAVSAPAGRGRAEPPRAAAKEPARPAAKAAPTKTTRSAAKAAAPAKSPAAKSGAAVKSPAKAAAKSAVKSSAKTAAKAPAKPAAKGAAKGAPAAKKAVAKKR